MGNRDGIVELGSHSYRESNFTITRMATDEWYVFDDNGRDTGLDFKSLSAARRFVKTHDAAVVEGRY